MNIILKTDVEGVGFKNELITVKDGFGRNFLIPRGYAVVANDSNKKIAAENAKQAAHKAEKLKNDAQAVADKVKALKLSVPAKIGESGKIFGAITTLQISDAIKNQGYDVDRKNIKILDEINQLGTYRASISLHKEVREEIEFEVVKA